MSRFVLNQNVQNNGDHEVHDATTGCTFIPAPQNQIDLGWHPTCFGAVVEAKRRYPRNRINGCKFCCPMCHTS